MGLPFVEWIDDPKQLFVCAKCGTCLTGIKHLVSESFRGGTGTAYLFNHVINVNMTESIRRVMTTGTHWVRDIDCRYCNSRVGWFYEMALKEDQQYKEGHFILELALTKRIPGMVDIVAQKRMKSDAASSSGESGSSNNPSVSSLSFEEEKEDVTV
uniref:Protein yippee-like n=1 Tax=Panagrellus redivivus TaxID=6233 RepID=A0A7E5A0X5_PANRE